MSKNSHKARGHSELPPSSADKWMNCGGWLRTVTQHVERFGIPPTSKAALEGTEAHEKMESHITSKGFRKKKHTDKKIIKRHRKTGAVHPEPLDIDDDMYDDLVPIFDWIQDQPGILYAEKRVDFGAMLGWVDLTGTVDITLVEPERLTIADLKFGMVIVEVIDDLGNLNPQIMCYLLGAINEHGPRKEYRLVILQPRAWHKKGPIREVIVSHAQVEIFKFELDEAVTENYGNGGCRVGPWCYHYCPALSSCRAVVRESLKAMVETPAKKFKR